ncbi:MAG: helix-turn-helix domain-containing protein [Acholeplasmataceae bacterium]
MANRSRFQKYWLSSDGLDKIATMRKGGYTIEEIAHTIGIGRSTIHKWAQNNETLKDILLINSEVAIIEAESQLMKNIKNGNQRAVEFFLLNRASNRWGNTQKVELTGSVTIEQLQKTLEGKKY